MRQTVQLAALVVVGLLLGACGDDRETVTVPRLEVGTSVSQARAVLEQAGLDVEVNRGPCTFSGATCDDAVTGTTPPAGAVVDVDSEVMVHHGNHLADAAPPSPPFVLDCLAGVNGTSSDYEFAGGATTYPTPQGVAGRALAAHTGWRAAVHVMGQQADVALFDAAGRVEGILRVARQGSGWALAGDRACEGIDLYR